MLVFVIPLRSPQASKSWEYVSKLFERCIRSVCNQTSDNFRAIVVCHKRPEIEFRHPHISYIEVDFPPPDNTWKAKSLDRMRKILIGLKFANQFQPSHVMRVDADDCISRKLAKFIENNPQSNGWFITTGYRYDQGSKFLRFREKGFYRMSGTSNIIRYDLINLPESIEDWMMEAPKKHLGPPFVHQTIIEYFSQQGNPLEPLPFAGAVYIVGHEEQLSKIHPHQSARSSFAQPPPPKIIRFLHRMKGLLKGLLNLKQLLSLRPLKSSICNEFSLYPIDSL